MAKSLTVFDVLVAALQTEDSLSCAAQSILDTLWESRVAWAELRFCPDLHTAEGLTAQQAIHAVHAGVAKSRLPHSAVIVCALRSLGPEHALRMASDAVAAGAHGLDVAGNEQDFPSLEAVAGDAIRLAHASHIGVTAHAGEWPGTAGGVQEAVRLRVHRIGHGIAVAGSQELIELVREADVVVECCPTANVGSQRVLSFEQHPIRALLRGGVRATVSCDNLLASGNGTTGPPTPCGELLRLLTAQADGGVGLTPAEVVAAVRHGAQAAFGTPEMHTRAADALLLRAEADGTVSEATASEIRTAHTGRELLDRAVSAVAEAELEAWTHSEAART